MSNLPADLKKLEAFFAPENLAKLNIKCDEIALVLVDVQKEFADPKGARGNETTDVVAQRIATLAPVFRNAGIKIYAVYNKRNSFEATWGITETSHKHDPLVPVDPKFHAYTPEPQDELISKRDDNAFVDSLLDFELKSDGKKFVLVAGFNASGCEYLTARSAAKKGYETCYLTDLSANDDYASIGWGRAWDFEKELKSLRDYGVITAPTSSVLETLAEMHENGSDITAKDLGKNLRDKNCDSMPLPATLTVPPTPRAWHAHQANNLGR